MRSPSLWAAVLLLLLAPLAAEARVTAFNVVWVQSPAFGGRSFGTVGTYDRIMAHATIAVDPADPHDAGIVDLALAPRNAQGLVEGETEVEILRPTDPSKANGRLFYEVVNRGHKLSLTLFNDAPPSAVPPNDQAGNGFLMNRGYTIVWAGWQGDIPSAEGRLGFVAPLASGVTGRSRDEFVFDNTVNPVMMTLSYPLANLAEPKATLTVREHADDRRLTPGGLAFAFLDPLHVSIVRPAEADAGAIYELIYQAQDSKVMGLGFAATRDIVAFLRHGSARAGNPLAAMQVTQAIGFGASQSGRYLRDFLYQGFNEDENGHIVFEGLMPHIAGSKKTFINYRFAEPGRHAQQHSENTFPGDQFPFTYPVLHDPISGRKDGLLARCLAHNNCPKIMQTDSGLELYQSRASLVVTDPAGAAVELPDNVRVYLLANLPHFAPPNAVPGSSAICLAPLNPLHAGAPMRALLVAMEAWLADGTLPPASRYPSRADGTLVPPEKAEVGFPAIPGFAYSGVVNRLALVDDEAMPPTKGLPYPVFVGKTDADGHDVAGIRLPAVAAPLATYVSWNFRKEGFAAGDLCDLAGATLPLARTKAERLGREDPRLSIAERYPNPGDYAAAVTGSAQHLVADRLMLPEDAQAIIAAAKTDPTNRGAPPER